MNLNIYTFCYNESELIEFIHEQWKKNLPEAKFILIDNHSEDDSISKATKLGYEGIQMSATNDKFSDERNMNWSNNLPYKPLKWCSITDMDEVAQITEEELSKEDAEGTTIIRFEGWNVFSRHDDGNVIGSRMPRFDKFIMFNHDKVKMNFGAGRHECYPQGDVKYSKKVYKLFHYGMWSEEYYINRRKMYNERWSEKNLQMGWGLESRKTEEELRNNYRKLKEKAIKIV